MTTTNTPRPRRVAGRRPSAVPASARPRRLADSRRVADRAAGGPAGSALGIVGPTGDPALTPESAAEPTSGRTRERSPWRPRRSALTVVLLAVAVVLAVAVGLGAWNLRQMEARADARKAAQLVATDSVEAILSYDHAGYDRGVARAERLMTDDFAKKYADTVASVRPDVLATKAVVKAQVVASSVVSAEPDRVRALLFVNQTTTGTQVRQPRVDLNRVVVTLVRGDRGTWLVSDIDAL